MTTITAHDLRTEHLTDPLNIERADPRLQWRLASATTGAAPSAYRVRAATTQAALADGNQLLWDSGKVAGAAIEARWGGAALGAAAPVWWQVQVWDQADAAGAWSAPARFGTGLTDWGAAQWIRCPWAVSTNAPSFRRSFTTTKPTIAARIFVTARGVLEGRIDGAPISDEVFAPGWTDYHKRLLYRGYDVTAQVREAGEHVLGFRLGEGWFKGPIGWQQQANVWGDDTELLVSLHLTHSDGSTTVIVSDGEWKVANSPILASTWLRGELFDAGLEQPGWDRPGFAAKGWAAARTKQRDATPIEAHRAPPVRRTAEFKPVRKWSPRPGVWIFDLGRNIAGRVRLRTSAPAGTSLRLRHGEMVNPDQTLYVDNLRSAVSTDVYTCAGGDATYEPTFTFHGFQYVELSGWPGEPPLEAVTGIVLGTDNPVAGTFTCSSDLLNTLYGNLVWTQRANYLEVPTDCPQRDERLGWTGDAQAFIRTGAWNHDIAGFFTKWQQDMRDAVTEEGAFSNFAPHVPGLGAKWGLHKGDAAWADAGTICPWTVWRVYGDRDQLADAYPAMVRWVGYLERTSLEGVGLRFHRDKQFVVFGDWLSVDSFTPREVIMTAFFAYSTQLTAEAAEELGKVEDAKRLRGLHAKIVAAFARAFVRPDGTVVGNTSDKPTQTGQLLALHFGLMPAGQRAAATERLVELIAAKDWHLDTGFVGLPYLLPVLSANGRADVAWRLLLTTTYPSWGYPITQGATTIWERWNGWTKDVGPADPGMNSYSHYAYGACGEWFFSDIAGIELLEPAFKRFRVRPRTDGPVEWAEASYVSPYGTIASSWKRSAGKVTLEVTVPPGTTAEVHLPDGSQRVVGSGKHSF